MKIRHRVEMIIWCFVVLCTPHFLMSETEVVANNETVFNGELPVLTAGISSEDWSEEIEVDIEAEIEEVEEIKVEEPPYTQYELDMLAHLIYAECGNLSDKSLYICGSVVLNRISSKKYPNTMEDVINQKSQYSTHKSMWNKNPSDRCYEIAKDLLTNGTTVPENVLYQAMFKQGDGVYFEEKGEYFCYE